MKADLYVMPSEELKEFLSELAEANVDVIVLSDNAKHAAVAVAQSEDGASAKRPPTPARPEATREQIDAHTQPSGDEEPAEDVPTKVVPKAKSKVNPKPKG